MTNPFPYVTPIFGDAPLTVLDNKKAPGTSNTIYGTDGIFFNLIVGDVDAITLKGIGGNDVLVGGSYGTYDYLYGDAFDMSGSSRGGR